MYSEPNKTTRGHKSMFIPLITRAYVRNQNDRKKQNNTTRRALKTTHFRDDYNNNVGNENRPSLLGYDIYYGIISDDGDFVYGR